MSVRADNKAAAAATTVTPAIGSLPLDVTDSTALSATPEEGAALAEAAAVNPNFPLKRNVCVVIRASLNDFCLQKTKATWSPSPEALKQIFQQKKFTDLAGAAEQQGDLRSIVLHNMKLSHVKSSFPFSIGARMTGVDDITYSLTGEPYSTIVLPNSESVAGKCLQADDTELAYEFAKKFPGYTSSNLGSKGVHEVQARRFVLVAADHPIVSAISENADKLQMGEISMMPEGLVKLSSSLYESILPLVRTQVESQIKVRDFSRASVSIAPAEFGGWTEARNEMMVEAKRPLKAQLAAELREAADGDAQKIRDAFAKKETMIENEIDNRPLEVAMELEVQYNFLSGK